ncbi:SpaA isopeptide-forming pilin-related protein, partial [uncultured Cellulomonas sp.]|uniref:SpaA isopeptide-forming pilin-related protein n=1 Tax=uncultured Cellulomonas sp. TaxID=189682 RepID=UPI0026051D6E
SQTFTVSPGLGFTVPVSVPAPGPWQGSVVLSGGGVPVPGAVVEVRNASCSTVFSRMRTGADGSFPVTANPGTYCLVPVSVPAGFALPGSQTFAVSPGPGFTVPVRVTTA